MPINDPPYERFRPIVIERPEQFIHVQLPKETAMPLPDDRFTHYPELANAYIQRLHAQIEELKAELSRLHSATITDHLARPSIKAQPNPDRYVSMETHQKALDELEHMRTKYGEQGAYIAKRFSQAKLMVASLRDLADAYERHLDGPPKD